MKNKPKTNHSQYEPLPSQVFNVHLIFLILILIVYTSVHIYKMGSVSYTGDEKLDVEIVRIYVQSKNPFGCFYDITQTRFPYYFHAIFCLVLAPLTGKYSHHIISLIFGLVNLLLIYSFTKKNFNNFIANTTLLLTATSIPVLTSSRMVLSHSNVIFTTFTILTVITFFRFIKDNDFKFLIYSAVFFGFSVGSSALGIFTVLYFLVFYSMTKLKDHRFTSSHLSFIPISLASFFLSSIIYTDKTHLFSFIKHVLSGEGESYRNFLNLGTHSAPFWYSFLIFIVKVTPWWSLFFIYFVAVILDTKRVKNNLRIKFLSTLFLFVIFYFIIKSFVFRYDAPHQQVHLFPFVYLIMAYSIFDIFVRIRRNRLFKNLFVGTLLILFAIQIAQISLFFPNFLFYGSQYGKDFVGEFYGPAVAQFQDFDQTEERIKKILQANKNMLIPDPTAVFFKLFQTSRIVPFTRRNKNKYYEYAFLDYPHGYHLNYPYRDDYVHFINEYYTKCYTYYFPNKFEMYTIYKRKD